MDSGQRKKTFKVSNVSHAISAQKKLPIQISFQVNNCVKLALHVSALDFQQTQGQALESFLQKPHTTQSDYNIPPGICPMRHTVIMLILF